MQDIENTTVQQTATAWWPFGVQAPGRLGRLFTFPYAGAGAGAFAAWRRDAPPGLTVVPVQLPGREQRVREAAEPNLLRLIDRLAPEVAPFTSSRYSLFGHSMGALVAFELARGLRRLGCPPPDRLFLAGRGAPGTPMPQRPIHMLPDREFVEEIRQLRGTPDAVIEHAEFASLFLPVLRADFALVETYTCPSEPPLASPISVFGGVDDAIGPDALEGWRAHTAGDFELHMLPGGHFLVANARPAILGAIANELGRRGRIQVSP